MTAAEDVREKIQNLIIQKKESMNDLSLRIGKNQTYLFQYITRGSPRRLDEVTRKKLAQILDVPEQELTDIPLTPPLPGNSAIATIAADTITSFFKKKANTEIAATEEIENVTYIDILDVTACCGNGIENLSENVCGQWVIPVDNFRAISLSSNPRDIKMLCVSGDSMEPTLKDGDWVLADISRQTPESDGIYLLRLSTGLAVKRLQGSAVPNSIRILSDNERYKEENAKLSDITILGKIIYILKTEKVG